ncbi:MAG: hypothetical protein LUO85_04180 [Methanomassiliicoccales archaeon]|nr:hypothetical protein [Methanomassiliicoccales archaeon]
MDKRIIAYAAAVLILGALPPLILAIALPDPTFSYYGFAIGGMLAVVLSFTARFPANLGQSVSASSLSDIAHLLRMNGLMAEEKPKSINVRLDRWNALSLSYQARGSESKLVYRLDATPSTMAVLMFLFLGIIFGVLAIPLCIYLLIEMHRYATRFVIPNLSGPSGPLKGPKDEIKGLLVDSLTECQRLAEDAHRAENSAYDDSILIVTVVIGLFGGLALLVVFSQLALFDTSYRSFASVLLAFTISIAATAIGAILIGRRMKPKIEALGQWVVRLNQAASVELTDQMREGNESSIELLFSAYDEMPLWLNSRRKSTIDRYPTMNILMIMLAIWGASLTFSGAFSLASDGVFGLLALSIGVMLMAGAYGLERKMMALESAEETRMALEWGRRRERLQTMVGIDLEENMNV